MSNLGNKEIMAQNILFYMARDKKTRADMCAALDVPYTTFTDWVKGNAYPRIDKIEAMANYFGIAKADLVEERPAPVPKDGPLSEFQDLISQLTPEEQKLIVSQIKGILSNRE